MKPTSTFNIRYGDLRIEQDFALKTDQWRVDRFLNEIPKTVQVAADTVILPKGLVITIRKIVLSQGSHTIRIAFFKSKQDVFPMKSFHSLLPGDALNGLVFSEID